MSESNKNLLVEFTLSPLDKGESVGDYVSRSISIIDESGVDYKLGPMGTCLEGTYDEIFSVIKECFIKMQSDCNRITGSIKIDYRKGHTKRLESKIKRIESKLGKKLKV